MTKKQKVQLDAKITPEQVKEKLKEKEKKPREVKPLEFPVEARINAYGFLHFKVGLLAALGWHKDMPLKIGKNADGSITVREA